MVAAEEAAVLLQPVADDLHLAVLARGRELVDRALEAVEGVAPAALRDRERLVVVVPAGFALRHGTSAVDQAVIATRGVRSCSAIFAWRSRSAVRRPSSTTGWQNGMSRLCATVI